jgi:hypothetical protein
MGREAITRVEIGGEAADVRALLESTELILRGDNRRRLPRDRLADVRVDGEVLRFICKGENLAPHLGSSVAQKWAKAIATPSPSLRAKPGVASGARAYRVGGFEDAALEEAIAGTLADMMADADAMIACLAGPNDLDTTLAAHAANPAVPIWPSIRKARAWPSATAKSGPCFARSGSGTVSPVPCPNG